MGYRPISTYGIIGNDDRCALVGRDGSIDWCCFPHVAAPSVFGRLLDDERGGHFAIEPTGEYDSTHAYRPRTNVLETQFDTASGRIVLTDLMPSDNAVRRTGAQRAIYRHVECTEGTVTIEVDVCPRFDYARADTSVETRDDHLIARSQDEELSIQALGALELESRESRAVGWTTLEAGEECWVVLQYDHVDRHTIEHCKEIASQTVAYWREWAVDLESCAEDLVVDEAWLEYIIRSGLVLKLLINEGSGAIYAAVTTSLPEEFGGDGNWDYRYNWIRDAKFTVQALYTLGQSDEAHEYFRWFRGLTHDGPSSLQPVYGVHGERALTEETLDHLAGYRFSQPVRIGNAAAEQKQLDIYGAIVQGMYETLLHDERLTEEDWDGICTLVDYVCDVWDERDAGIWEYRNEPRHYVHSKLLCWVALDRGIELAERHEVGNDIESWKASRQAVRDAIESRGYSESAESFVQHFDTDDTFDASCLLIPIYEFLPPDDPRVESTIDTVMDVMMTEEGFVKRTVGPDSRPEGPGAFLFCTFWLVDALVLSGRRERAMEIFQGVLDYVDPPYLLAERIDPRTGEAMGNFPQAFSHIGLVNSAIYLQDEMEDRSLPTGVFASK